ncbi:hypothetical protein K443DRAFT_133773 [Laccaria amethystina LaAM-08-1]|uniref:F-box domain-containing protein n=1 Tax=Laccaria amethystina LaAM-08-1 TaxID=1095629 RepID=A0A0C9XNU1_9AGAR|nr:hypothetical protein K443DRAFT_133773 [Laccaria amethystina LaAM-08-1]
MYLINKLGLPTNHPLTTQLETSPVELQVFSDFVNVGDQIKEYEKMTGDLQVLQKRQRWLMRKCNGLRSLVRSLPDELLSWIFTECIPTEGATVSLETSVHEAPMLLCHVCSRWRSVAFSTPQLWNRLVATIGPAPPPHSSHSLKLISLVQEWFDRAKTLPLSLRFASHLNYFECESLDDLIAQETYVPHGLLCPLSSRLRCLDLTLGWTPVYLEGISEELKNPPFPRLESLILRAFQDAKRLRRVAMHYPIFGNNLGNVLFPWEQLTHFIVSERIQHGVFEDLLQRCTFLQQCVLNLAATPISIPAREVKTVHHLIDLTITMESSLNPSILQNFEFPALKSLRLGPLIIAEEHWEERVHLLTHFSNIQRLSFMAGLDQRKTLPYAHVIELLRYAENVEGLELFTTPAPTPTKSLTSESAPTPAPTPIAPATLPPLLPKLFFFSIDLGAKPRRTQALRESIEGRGRDCGCYPRQFSPQALGKMIQSRWAPFGGGSRFEKDHGSVRLEKLHVYLTKEDEYVSDAIHGVLAECVDDGLIFEERRVQSWKHWSSRLNMDDSDNSVVHWPEGLSLLVHESGSSCPTI